MKSARARTSFAMVQADSTMTVLRGRIVASPAQKGATCAVCQGFISVVKV
jgi:hypothetical protein